MGQPTKIFIVEGEDRDYRLINELTSTFLGGRYQAKVILASANKNIYMLFQLMKESEFETDIVEVIREKIPGAKEILDGIKRDNVDEVFLFFDLDWQQNNIPLSLGKSPFDILTEMVSFFDNETENGKLFISYPMIEATYDFVEDDCRAFSNCFIPIENIANYKSPAGDGNPVSSWHFDYCKWKKSMESFNRRILCFFECESLGFYDYRRTVQTKFILERQLNFIKTGKKVFVLSACPQFLFDYFPESFWSSHFTLKNKKQYKCDELKA